MICTETLGVCVPHVQLPAQLFCDLRGFVDVYRAK